MVVLGTGFRTLLKCVLFLFLSLFPVYFNKITRFRYAWASICVLSHEYDKCELRTIWESHNISMYTFHSCDKLNELYLCIIFADKVMWCQNVREATTTTTATKITEHSKHYIYKSGNNMSHSHEPMIMMMRHSECVCPLEFKAGWSLTPMCAHDP